MTIRHIGYLPTSQIADVLIEHFERTGERITEAYTQDHLADTYTFYLLCNICKQIKTVTVPGPGLFRYNQGDNIQVAFPDLSADDRELLMSNTCGSCYDALFPAEEDDFS